MKRDPRFEAPKPQATNKYAKCGEDETTELLMVAAEIRAVLAKHGMVFDDRSAIRYANRRDPSIFVDKE